MGVYIKGVTKQELKEIFGKACILYNSADLVDVETPHGDLIDREEIEVVHYTDADGEHIETNAPTVIEVEVE